MVTKYEEEDIRFGLRTVKDAIKEINEAVERLKEKGCDPDTIRISTKIENDYGDVFGVLRIEGERKETEEEKRYRLECEAADKVRRKQEYLRLKKEFENE